MRKYFLIIILLISSKAFSHTEHYKGIKKIEMDVLRNGEIIGYSNYFFEQKDNNMTVKNYTKFNVELFGVSIFSILSEAVEKYENDELISYKSNTKHLLLNFNALFFLLFQSFTHKLLI